MVSFCVSFVINGTFSSQSYLIGCNKDNDIVELTRDVVSTD